MNVEWLLEARFAHSRYIDDRDLLYIRDGKRIRGYLFTEPRDIGKLLVFGILGIAFVAQQSLQVHLLKWRNKT